MARALRACLLFALALGVPGDTENNIQQCDSADTDAVSTPSMMQKATLRQSALAEEAIAPEPEPEPESGLGTYAAPDARFLMQASFGPTRESMAEMSKTTYSEWIAAQMKLPVGSHREYYRSRVNPSFDPSIGNKVAKPGTPCEKGARWHSFAFTYKDQWETIFVNGTSTILVGGFPRTGIKQHPLASSWVAAAGFQGRICAVDEAIGGDVVLSTDVSCRKGKKTMPNPAIYMPSAPEVAYSFTPVPVKPGVVVLGERPPTCMLDQLPSTGGPLIIKIGGEPHMYDARYRFVENVPGNPMGESQGCVHMNALNEKSCRVQLVPGSKAKIPGLTVEVIEQNVQRGKFISEVPGPLKAVLLDKEVFHSNARWPGFSPYYFAARWTGSLGVLKGGIYTLWAECGNGNMRVYVDSAVVAEARSLRGRTASKSGNVTLSAGSHNITVEFARNFWWDPRVILSWKGPDSGNEKVTVPQSALSTVSQGQSRTGCPVSCGSPGEVANDPSEGHQLPMFMITDTRHPAADGYDNRYGRGRDERLAKPTVWIMKALEGEDQLRQRVAWALSQIFVVSTEGIGLDDYTEMWVNYYDIFVRNAFGSYLDVMREVTFSPLMGRYLTHSYTESYDYKGRFPNENYAREIMQLFTIGLDKLNKDGTKQVDINGQDVNTYTNDNIMQFARVFTGFRNQPRRVNTELDSGSGNFIDPMVMSAVRHDMHPKNDLDGNFIGDGYPLCTDAPPGDAFLAKGAKFHFRPLLNAEGALVLGPQSDLLAALCQGVQCGSVYSVELKQTLACSGNECGAGSVKLVKAGDAIYEYVRPPCVNTFIAEPTPNLTSYVQEVKTQGACAYTDATGGVWRWTLDRGSSLSASSPERQAECLGKCKAKGAYGCMLYVHRSRSFCFAMIGGKGVFVGNGHSRYTCWYFNMTGLTGNSYTIMPRSTKACAPGTEITSLAECRQSVLSTGNRVAHHSIVWRSNHWYPLGCSYNGRDRIYWSIKTTGSANRGAAPVCKASVTVDADHQLVTSNGKTRFAVPWLDGTPSPGIYAVTPQIMPVFSLLPATAVEAKARLSIGAFGPKGSCDVCSGEVKAYFGAAGVLSAETVFEVDGRFYRNAENVLVVPGGKRLCRNPPQFMGKNDDLAGALAEVEATLEHLFHHPNTPVFVAKRLIQRFVTSNPTPGYVSAVVGAFSSGAYNGTTYSGQYGDLGATVAAILLHPEARGDEANGGTTADGALREPMVKVMHLMRSMEYKDADGGQVVFAALHNTIGQFPYHSPSVFNFYLADFELPMMKKPKMMPEPEPMPEPEAEPEPEPEPESALVGPEFEIFTPPFLIGYLNGMSSLIKSGVNSDCSGPRYSGVGTRVFESEDGVMRLECPQGQLSWPGAGEPNETLRELDVLLTGGRLTPVAKEVVKNAYEAAPPGKELQAAQQAVVMTAEFNTLGAPLPKPGARPALPAESSSGKKDYKALVMLFLHGGADTWNMLVPQECGLYQEYRDMRTDLALNPNELIQITTTGQKCSKFGVHASFRSLKGFYDAGEAAFVSNIGSLPEPTTKETWRDGSTLKCFNMFSHSDQQRGAQTLKCQDVGATAQGTGGRIADALAKGSQKYKTTSFTFSNSPWSKGRTTRRKIINSRGATKFTDYEEWIESIGNITAQQHGNVYADRYAEAFRDGIEDTQSMGNVLQSVKLLTNYPQRSSLSKYFAQVAKMIAGREMRKAQRDFFFVQYGGWDHHSMMKDNTRSKFGTVDSVLRDFVAEMQAQKVWESVAVTTSSEFARTLDSNGGGSDHAWAGQHFILSGGLKGKHIFNKFPESLKAGNKQDLGRGRLIPQYPWESVMVPIAEWMGIEAADKDTAFPNLKAFNSSFHIIPRKDLFKP